MEIRTIFVVGAGVMGAGIAEVAARSGFQILLSDVEEGIVIRAKERMRERLEKAQQKGKLKADEAEGTLGRIQVASNLADAKTADVVIEAVTENESLKKQVFKSLDGICPPHTILASNTSAISITKISSATQRPEKVIGTHFFNPVPVMKLVEIVRGYLTSEETIAVIRDLCRKMGNETILAKDYPGFLTTRIGILSVNAGVYALYRELGSVEDIDKGIRLGSNQPMGPLELADLIGLDTVVNVLQVLYEGLGEQQYFPCPLLHQMITAGHLGRKTGKGFYDYSGGGKKPAM